MFQLNDIVVVIADRPDGTQQTQTKGEIGFVYKVSRDLKDYEVVSRMNDYFYSEDQIRLATEEEIKGELLWFLKH